MACTGTSPYSECHAVDLDVDGNPVPPAEADTSAVLHSVQRYIDALQAIEDEKKQRNPDLDVHVIVIAGVAPDGTVTYADASDPIEQTSFGIGPGCISGDGRATPPVRLRALAEAFRVGDEQNMFSICDTDYSVALGSVARSIEAQVEPTCIPGCAADTDPTTAEIEPACVVVQSEPQSDGTTITTEIPPCTPNGELPSPSDDVCYIVLSGPDRSEECIAAGSNQELRLVRREGSPPNGGTAIFADCEPTTDCPLVLPD